MECVLTRSAPIGMDGVGDARTWIVPAIEQLEPRGVSGVSGVTVGADFVLSGGSGTMHALLR